MIERKSNEKISVIVPIYNVEAYLERCLISICKQTYENLEIILINDGSPDNCLKICKEFANKDSRIIVISQSNQGVSSARNMGLRSATGDYIAFVDSDDYIHPEMYERLYSLLKMNDADMSACFLRGCWGSNYSEPPRDDIVTIVYDKIGAIKTIFDPKYGLNGAGVVVTNKLIKKDLFDNLFFNTNFRRGEDEQIICYLMKRVNKFVITDERLYYYFHRSNSALHGTTSEVENVKVNLNLLNMYEERLLLFKENEFNDIYDICFTNMMNLIITFFFTMNDKKSKKPLVRKYGYHFREFYKRIVINSSLKNKIRYLTFRICPPLYIIILVSSKK